MIWWSSIKAVCYFLISYLLVSCASNTELTVADEEWVFEERAINLEIDAPADLNTLNGRPHALAIGFFQLSDPNTFTGLVATREGAEELLGKGRIDDTVAYFRRITVQPGEHRTVVINRAKTAQHIGLIVGYYNINPKNDVSLFKIPIKPTERGLVEKLLVALQLVKDEANAKPEKLFVQINLGRLGTKRMIELTKEDKIKNKKKKKKKNLELNDSEIKSKVKIQKVKI